VLERWHYAGKDLGMSEHRDWQSDEIEELKNKLLKYMLRYSVLKEIIQHSDRTVVATMVTLIETCKLWDEWDAEDGLDE
jgi:hypothetical protein